MSYWLVSMIIFLLSFWTKRYRAEENWFVRFFSLPMASHINLVANYPRIGSGLVHPSYKWDNPSDLHGIFVGLIHWNHWGELTHLRFVGWATKQFLRNFSQLANWNMTHWVRFDLPILPVKDWWFPIGNHKRVELAVKRPSWQWDVHSLDDLLTPGG